jgi:DNA relaxase NicK
MFEPTAGDYGCHLQVAGGDTCQPIVDELRLVLPDHKVSRVDVAADFDYPEAFKDLEGIALKVALEHKPKPLSTKVGGDHYQLQGRTSYFGSRTSTHFVRVYEKGHEQRSLGINPNASLDWSRFEIEVKPTKKGEARKQASILSPDQIAHSSEWTSQMSTALGATCGESVRLTTKRVNSPFINTMHHMARQYGPGIRKAIKNGEVTSKEMVEFFRTAILLGQIPREGLLRPKAETVKKGAKCIGN